MNERQRSVCSRLNFLSRLQKGDKIHVRNLIIQPRSWATSLYRTFVPCNRKDAVYFCRQVFEDAKNAMQHASDGKLQELLNSHVKSAIIGVQNMKVTYEADHMVCSELDTIVVDIQTFIQNMQHN